MPKIKTSRGAAKRFKISATGKILRARGFKSHLLSGKGRKRKRRLKRPAAVSPQEVRKIRNLVPYL